MSNSPERQELPPARINIDVLAKLNESSSIDKLLYFNACLAQPSREVYYHEKPSDKRKLLIDRMERAALVEITDAVGTDITGSPAVLSANVFIEDLLSTGHDARERFNREPCVFAGVTAKSLDGGCEEILLRFFTRRDGRDKTYVNYLVRPTEIEKFTSAPILQNLRRAAEVTKDTVLTPDFFKADERPFGPSQMDVLISESVKVGEAMPPGAYMVSCGWCLDLIAYVHNDSGEIEISEQPREIVGQLMSPTYAEYLYDPDPFKQFKTEADFWIGGGAPCVMINDQFLAGTPYAVPVDAISSIKLFNEDAYWQEAAKRQKEEGKE